MVALYELLLAPFPSPGPYVLPSLESFFIGCLLWRRGKKFETFMFQVPFSCAWFEVFKKEI